MRTKFLTLALLLGAIGLPAAAQAQNAVVASRGGLWAGPGEDYPRIAVLDRGREVQILGCLSGWGWCDVTWRGYRGWMRAERFRYRYGGRYVPLPEYGPRGGVPIINFSFNYWDDHYRSKNFYREREVYVRRHPEWRGPPRRDHDNDHDRGRDGRADRGRDRDNDRDRGRGHDRHDH